jgi:hypothetical protein
MLIICSFLQAKSVYAAATLNSPTSFMSSRPWVQLERKIDGIQDYVVINWRGRGGYSHVAMQFVDFVHARSNKITIKVTGPAVSSHAIVLCYLNNVKMTKSAKLVFHAGFINTRGPKVYVRPGESYQIMRPCVGKYLSENDLALIAHKHVRVEVYPNGNKKILPDWPNAD